MLLIDGLGTLVSLQAPAPALRRELALRYGVEVSEAEAARALAAEIAFYRTHMGEGRDADSLGALRRRCAEILLAALPHRDRLAVHGIESITDTLLSSLRFAAYADARDALVRARTRGAHVVVVSNWDVSLLEVLELVGLTPLLDGVVTSAAVGAAKPAPAVFHHALALAGVAAGRALHVGDSLAEDVRGAQACGIPAVLLARSGDAAPAGVTVISGLRQLDWP
ncbi:MAG TPA: HAD-IA family hydrolase [Solirubrobacteraceae bacterium]|nr:HAD-IA family hydrolase [Solirubrobacteraceae bacterium]